VSLATEVAMSRSAFAARFTELVGEPPIRYVARWRMHVALTWLKEEGAALGELAIRLGYQSEAAVQPRFQAFHRRFARRSPARWRYRGHEYYLAAARARTRFSFSLAGCRTWKSEWNFPRKPTV
jgi:AraC-like DNA-binding protein